MQNSMNLCQHSPTGQEQDWRDLYEKAFPADERTPLDELLQLLASGSVLLHRTLNKEGELLCFTIVYPLSNFTLLSYIATDQNKRSTGVGSKHMKRLMEIVKEKYPHHNGLFLEIESTRERAIDAAEQKTRSRRLAFYQRLGAKRLCRTYVWPSYGAKGAYRLAELLWIDFDPSTVDDVVLPGVIKEMYTKAYMVPEDDPLLALILLQFTCGSKVPLKEMVCAVESAKSDKPAEKTDATEASGDGKKDATQAATGDAQAAIDSGEGKKDAVAETRGDSGAPVTNPAERASEEVAQANAAAVDTTTAKPVAGDSEAVANTEEPVVVSGTESSVATASDTSALAAEQSSAKQDGTQVEVTEPKSGSGTETK